MKPRPRASPVIKIASPACDAQPNERCASDRLLAYVHACWLFALIRIDMAVTCTQRKQHAISPLSDYRVWQAG